jgi:methylenetetrahydrofolate dehydrogenase (NADP+)/methenyltetrahydrofolate cyclohydrolase
MSAQLLKGKQVSRALLKDLHKRAANITNQRGNAPHLAILSIGGNASSKIFLKRKLDVCKDAGVECTLEALPETIGENEVLRIIARLSQDMAIDGIILDLPIPEQLNARRITDAIAADKDVEGVSTGNFGKLFWEKSFRSIKQTDILIPCTAIAAIQLLLETGIDPKGKNAVVVGRSNIVGKPIAHLLSCMDATVTVCHSKTQNLRAHVENADILVSAIGKARLIKGDWIKEGAIVLDAGINNEGTTVCGDVDFENAEKKAAFITPVPGGIGPLTVTFLLHNTILSAEERTRRVLG